MGFWNFKACSKIDILKDPRHVHIIIEAVKDPTTKIDYSGNGIILYGEESALLVQDCCPTTLLMLDMIGTICNEQNR